MTEYNKVVYDGQTLIDLTNDDVQASDVRNGVYFHSADGVRSQGTLASTSVPTANTIAEWDNDVHMNSEDMTSQEMSDFVDSLDVTAIHAVDYVVEQGTDGIWTYRKWNSGIAECWGLFTESGAFASWGSIYSHDTGAQYYPTDLFTSKPIVVGQARCLGGNTVCGFNSNGGSMTQPPTFTIIRGTSLSGTQSFEIYYYAKGTWK